MPESSRATARAVMAALSAGALLAAAGWQPVWPALLGALLAQPAFALALSWRQRTRALPRDAATLLRRDLAPLLLLWAGAALAAAVLVAWPLATLLRQGTLSAALLLSGGLGVLVVALWALAPLWQLVEREGVPLARAWAQAGARGAGHWRGLG
ncbi:MAG: hypothetical protein QM601_00065, partial [Pseudoxanthomonas sp.]